MGLFDWIKWKSRQTKAERPRDSAPTSPPQTSATPPCSGLFGRQRPKILIGEDGTSLFLVVDYGNGVSSIIDREMFEYLYEESSAPDPSQRQFDAMLNKATRIRVIASAMFRGRALGPEIILDTSDAKALARLRRVLKIFESPDTFTHCACLGGPTLELYTGEQLLATIGVHHGHSVRWAEWKHDARLTDERGLKNWLIENGVEPAFLDVLFHNQYDYSSLMGMSEIGFQRHDAAPLSPREQRLRLVELERVRGGNLDEALAACQKELDAEPDLAFGYAVRGLIHRQRGDQARCLADCNEAIRLGLREAEIYFTRAVANEMVGRLSEALDDCNVAIELAPANANPYNSRGLIHARLSQFDEANADLSEAIRLAPGWPLPLLQRGQVQHSLGDLTKAVADYDQAIDLLKQTPPGKANETSQLLALAHCRRGEVRFDQFYEEDAEVDFDEARRLDPHSATGYLGEMWMRRSQFGRALELFSQLAELRPDDARTYIGRGISREALGELEAAAADYTEAVRLQPAGDGYALRSRVRQQQGRPDEALADLSEHVRLHPIDLLARLSRASLYKQQGMLVEAFADLNTAQQMVPDDPVACNNLAWMLATCSDDRLRNGTRAEKLARKACEATQWKHPFFIGTLAAACAESGKFGEAIHWQEKALELYPDEERLAGQSRLELYEARQAYRE